MALSVTSMKGNNGRSQANISNRIGHPKSVSKLPRSSTLASVTGYTDKSREGKENHSFKIPSRLKITSIISSATMAAVLFDRTKDNHPATPVRPEINRAPSPPQAPVKAPITPVDAVVEPAPAPKHAALPSNEGSLYIGPSIGDPCTTNALDHLLTCGHKVITHHPVSCTTNCCGNHGPRANPREIGQKFACLACITKTASVKHAEQVKSFRKELEETAKTTMKPFPKQWVENRMAWATQGFKDAQGDEMIAESRKGTFCYPIYVDPEFEGAVATIVQKRLRDQGKAQDAAAKALVADVSA